MKSELLGLCDHLVTAAVNGVYQGIIVTILVYLGLRVLGRTNAATRHAVWFATLLLLVSLFPAHWLLDNLVANPLSATPENVASVRLRAPDSAQPSHGHADRISSEDMIASAAIDSPTELFDEILALSNELGSDRQEMAAVVLEPPASGNGSSIELRDHSAIEAGADNQQTLTSGKRTPLKAISWNLLSTGRIPRSASLILLGVWLAIAGARLTFLTWRLHQVRRLKHRSLPANPSLDKLFGNLLTKLGVRRKVELKLSPTQLSAMVLGFARPVVLLPAGAAQSENAAEAEHVLRHELAHVRRFDDWANLVQQFFQAALFFHPAIWWVSKQLSLEREIACDDYVLQQGGRPRAYALLLAELASRVHQCRPMLAPGVSTNKTQLQKRINMILNTRRNTSPRLAKARLGFIASTAAVIAVLALYSAPRLVLAQPPAAPTPALPPGAAIAGGLPPDVAPAAARPEAQPMPVPELADVDEPGTPSAPDIGPGPKNKPGNSDYPTPPPVAGVPALAPVSPSVPVIAGVPGPETRPLPPVAAVPRTPRPPRTMEARNEEGRSLEARLHRVERMVEMLMAQQHGKQDPDDFIMKERGPGKAMPHPKEVEQMQERAERQAARAEEQAKRAAEQLEKAKRADRDRAGRDQIHASSEKELDALRKAREALEREMQRLDRQIEKIEQDRERMEHDQKRHAELLDEPSQDEQGNAEEAAN